jgi:hypothetical protein
MLSTRPEELVMLAKPGPWTAVSGLVGYGERLWFVNAELFVNHNSADVYSYDPLTSRAHYETHLFSQNAGLLAVADGLLYWPFEDARSSSGRGAFMVTDGRAWTWHLPPEGQVFHIYAMLGHRGTLFAATSAWRGGMTGIGALGDAPAILTGDAGTWGHREPELMAWRDS